MTDRPLARWTAAPLDRAGRIGADPRDSPDATLQKQVAVVLCAGTLPLTALWSAICRSRAPYPPSLFTPLNTALFARTRNNVGFYRFSQLPTILILPWLVMLALGGFGPSSMVIICTTLCPLKGAGYTEIGHAAGRC
jgi:adenylate cyclase